MRKVIVNSKPLIVLCGIGKLNILKEMKQNGFYISNAVERLVLEQADEKKAKDYLDGCLPVDLYQERDFLKST